MPGYNSKIREKLRHELRSNIVVQYSIGPTITLDGGTTAREYVNSQSHFTTDSQSVRLSWCRAPSGTHDQIFNVDRLGNRVHPMIQTLFPNNDLVLQDDNATQLELFRRGLKGMKVNFNIFPRQQSHQI
jgi:hypothetical protein